jgi:hypothetical protein
MSSDIKIIQKENSSNLLENTHNNNFLSENEKTHLSPR